MHKGPGRQRRETMSIGGQLGNGRAADSYLLRHAGIGASRKWRSVAVSDRRGRSPVAVGTDRLGNGRRGSKQSCRVALWVNPLQARASSCCSSATSRSSVGDPRPRHQSGPTSHPSLGCSERVRPAGLSTAALGWAGLERSLLGCQQPSFF